MITGSLTNHSLPTHAPALIYVNDHTLPASLPEPLGPRSGSLTHNRDRRRDGIPPYNVQTPITI
jgi:hypothetical protein